MAKKITITLTEGKTTYERFMAYKEKVGLQSNKGVLTLLLARADQAVILPKNMTEYIRSQDWFKFYHDLKDFVVDATREAMMMWRRATGK